MNPIFQSILREEFDYQILQDALADYSRPRDKIRNLIKKKEIIRVKKGLYVLGDGHRKRPYSRELLANLIYGPSYVSLEYALSYHGMIPERVESVTSVTCGKNRSFQTPIGRFTYWFVPLVYYCIGFDLIETENDIRFLMATPEKALSDKLLHDRKTNIRHQADMEAYLLNDLRLEEKDLQNLNVERIETCARHIHSRKLKTLLDYIRKRGKT
jgi:hypothetical protein